MTRAWRVAAAATPAPRAGCVRRWPARLAAATVVLVLAATSSSAQGSRNKPRVPAGRDPGGVAVAIVGPGIDYRVPEIARRLARDGEGDVVGWDFVDQDHRPLEAGEARPGTAAAAIVLAEARGVRLVPVRMAAGDPRIPGQMMVFLARSPAKVALVLAASARREDWSLLDQAARHFADRLLIVPAGGGAAAFPAGLGLATVLTVAVAEPARALPGAVPAPAEGKVGAAAAADVATAVEGAATLVPGGPGPAFDGAPAAAARVAALAARILAAEPGLTGAALKARILALAAPPATPGRAPLIAEIERAPPKK